MLLGLHDRVVIQKGKVNCLDFLLSTNNPAKGFVDIMYPSMYPQNPGGTVKHLMRELSVGLLPLGLYI